MPLKQSDVFLHCERLLDEFPKLRERSRDFSTHDELTQMAEVGFSFACSHELSAEELALVESQRDESDAEFGEKWQSFKGLALGYFLGQHRCGEIDEPDLLYVFAVLPGFMFLNSPMLTEE